MQVSMQRHRDGVGITMGQFFLDFIMEFPFVTLILEKLVL